MLLPLHPPPSRHHTAAASKLIELFDKADYDMVSRTERPERGSRVALIITKETSIYNSYSINLERGKGQQKKCSSFSPFFHGLLAATLARAICFSFFLSHTNTKERSPGHRDLGGVTQ